MVCDQMWVGAERCILQRVRGLGYNGCEKLPWETDLRHNG